MGQPSRKINQIGDLTRAEQDTLKRIWAGSEPLSALDQDVRQALADLYARVAGKAAAGSAQQLFNEARARYLLGQGPNPGLSVVDFARRHGLSVHRR